MQIPRHCGSRRNKAAAFAGRRLPSNCAFLSRELFPWGNFKWTRKRSPVVAARNAGEAKAQLNISAEVPRSEYLSELLPLGSLLAFLERSAIRHRRHRRRAVFSRFVVLSDNEEF